MRFRGTAMVPDHRFLVCETSCPRLKAFLQSFYLR
jgi:hypothetical protein